MPFDPPRYRGGDLIRAADVNARNDEIKRLDQRRSGPGIIVRTGTLGDELQLDLPEQIYIRLTSSANASGGYSWAEVVMTSPGTWTLTGRTGDQAVDPAYERRAGDVTLSAGPTVFRARRASPLDAWVFPHRKTTPPPSCAQICITVLGCSGNPVPSANVTISKSGFSISPSVTTLVSGFAISNPGSGYLATPIITISGGGGTGALAIPVVSGGVVSSTFLTSGGSNYTTAPSVLISGGSGSGATAIALYAPTTVASIALSNGGSNYTGIPSVNFTTPTGHTGSGATAAASMGVSAIAFIASGGNGYSVGDFLTLSGGTAATKAVLRVSTTSSGVITGVTIPTQGSYTVLPASPTGVTGGTGTGATFSLFWHVVSVAVTGAGSNYSTPPNVGFSGGSGSGAAATARLVATRVASVVVTAGGSGYNNNPGVTISDVSGSGATALATVAGGQVSLTVTNGGSGYSNPATVTVTIAPPTSGTTATATALLTTKACAMVPSTGLYTVTVTAARYATGSTTVTASTCTGTPTLNANISLVADANHVCCGSFYWQPVARTLHLTAPDGSHTLTYSSTSNIWATTPTFIPSGTFTVANGPPDANAPVTCSSSTSGPIDIGYVFSCSGSSFGLSYTYFLVSCCLWPGGPSNFYYAPSGSQYQLNTSYIQADIASAHTTTASGTGALSWTFPNMVEGTLFCSPSLIPYTSGFSLTE